MTAHHHPHLRRLVLGWVLALASAALGAGAALAQTAAVPPTIVSFQADLPAISVAEAEAGATTVTLSWRTANLRPGDRLLLQNYGRRGWAALAGTDGVGLGPDGLYVDRVTNVCGFCPPSYRLAILDAQNRAVDQWVLTIPWAAAQGEPRIAAFTTGVERVDANSLAQHSARITVAWRVETRVPGSHLVFEQVMEDGSAVSVELPRADLWVASSGQGEVAPLLPHTENYVTLRLRVLDTATGQTYDERSLTVPLIGAVTAPVVPTPVPQPPALITTGELLTEETIPPATPPQIVSFVAAPWEVDRGGVVAVSWSVANAKSVLLARLSPTGDFAEFHTNPGPAGVWTLTLPAYHTDSAEFLLVAIGAGDYQVDERTRVRVRCPYTYFFGSDPGAGCPESGELQVDAAYQTFERGFMIWRGDTRELYVFAQDGTARVFPDTWIEDEPVNIQATPPEGMYAPARGFGKLWLNQVDVMNALGWATSPELPYAMRVQRSGGPATRAYLALPDARVAVVADGGWRFVGG